ncbi:MAG: hypothetical protein HP477_06080 [Nitrospira sp.]|nr:hypothetical protein [Nitrospira sp.]
MGIFLGRLFPLKIVLATLGLTLGLGLPVLAQPVLDASRPTAAALASVLQTPKNVAPPRIRPPAIPENPITFNITFHPSKFVGLLPQFDGDGFAFAIPSRTEANLKSWSSKAVFEQVVSPFLSNIGVKNPASRFRLFDDHYQGRELPRADLKRLARITCDQWWIKSDKNNDQTCELLKTPSKVNPAAGASFKARTGMTVEQFVNSVERVTVEYFFTQEHEVKKSEHPSVQDVPAKVPLEHTGIRVERRKGAEGLFITGRVINNMTVSNVVSINPIKAHSAAVMALQKVKGIRSVFEKRLSPDELVLLPYGGTGGVKSRPAVKYAYRMVLEADFLGRNGTFYLWLDADEGEILQLVPTMESAEATGKTFRRDPGSLPETGQAVFHVDDIDHPPPDGKFVLSLSGVFKRLDRANEVYGNGEGELEKKPSDFSPPLEPNQLAYPPFDRDPMGMTGSAMDSAAKHIQNVSCYVGTNKDFAQIDLMATVSRYRDTFNENSPIMNNYFPLTEHQIVMDQEVCEANYSRANRAFFFGYCDGYRALNCPDSDRLNSAHDHTVVAHEFGHAFTQYQYGYPEGVNPGTHPRGYRLFSWCLEPTLEDGQRPSGTQSDVCPKPILPDIFHDFADAWSQVLEDTNCVGGWWVKNSGGTNYSKDCRYQGAGPAPYGHKPHDEGGGLPRLSEAVVDHFPEHRIVGQRGDYSDMQIASAALWEVREGLKRRDPVAGAMLYLQKFVQTLGKTGWLGQPDTWDDNSGYIDRDVYRYLVELEIKLVSHWWSGSNNLEESMVNKVVAGFARAGIFMIPSGCLAPQSTCNSGADAVIDVEPGKDYLLTSSVTPRFHIWTGPLYKFDGYGWVLPLSTTSSVCNTEYEVEIDSDRRFASPYKWTSTPVSGAWRQLPSGCHTILGPDDRAWGDLKRSSVDTRVYYRVRTRNSGGGDVRISTQPASGLFGDFDPPYVVVSGNALMDVTPPAVPGGLNVSP